ncbi:MAG: hypothetical protein AAB403_05865 [Planctomycetota bacterium]
MLPASTATRLCAQRFPKDTDSISSSDIAYTPILPAASRADVGVERGQHLATLPDIAALSGL